MKRRQVYFLLCIACFIICIIIVLFFNNDSFVRGYIGDFIIVILLYFFIKSIYDFQPINLALITLTFAFLTEFMQYIGIMNYFGLGNNLISKIIIGSEFDPFDLIAYVLGLCLAYYIDDRIIKKIIKDYK